MHQGCRPNAGQFLAAFSSPAASGRSRLSCRGALRRRGHRCCTESSSASPHPRLEVRHHARCSMCTHQDVSKCTPATISNLAAQVPTGRRRNRRSNSPGRPSRMSAPLHPLRLDDLCIVAQLAQLQQTFHACTHLSSRVAGSGRRNLRPRARTLQRIRSRS